MTLTTVSLAFSFFGAAAQALQSPDATSLRTQQSVAAAIKSRPGAVLLNQIEFPGQSASVEPSVSTYPKEQPVGRDQVTAHVELRCAYTEPGQASECVVMNEAPVGVGFADLALRLSPYLRIRPSTMGLTLSAGDTFTLPLTFRRLRMPPADAHVIAFADWANNPMAGRGLMSFYPPGAGGRAGRAVIRCVTSSRGSLADCRVEQENPAGLGFGEAALKASTLFKLWPAMIDGEPLGGTTIVIPIVFPGP